MRDRVEATRAIGVEHIFALIPYGKEDRCDRVMHRPSGSEAVPVWFEARLPFGFQSQLGKGLMRSIQHRRDAERTPLVFSWLGDPDPTGWSWSYPPGVAQGRYQEWAVFGANGFDAVNSRSALSLVVLRHPADR